MKMKLTVKIIPLVFVLTLLISCTTTNRTTVHDYIPSIQDDEIKYASIYKERNQVLDDMYRDSHIYIIVDDYRVFYLNPDMTLYMMTSGIYDIIEMSYITDASIVVFIYSEVVDFFFHEEYDIMFNGLIDSGCKFLIAPYNQNMFN